MTILGTPLTQSATRLMLLGSGELGKEVAIEAQRLGVEVIAVDRYADALGLAFQVKDDLLDIEGDSATLGKTAGKDLAQDKATFPALIGIEASRARLQALAGTMQAALQALQADTRALAALGRRVVERDR